jgi:hypothetical protein
VLSRLAAVPLRAADDWGVVVVFPKLTTLDPGDPLPQAATITLMPRSVTTLRPPREI